MKEILILMICLVLYVTAVEIFEGRADIARQGQLVEQETSFTYTPPSPPTTDDGNSVVVVIDD